MSNDGETLREFVVRNRGLAKDEAFAQVLAMPKVRAWIGHDDARRERLEGEFDRLWAEIAVPSSGGAAATTLVHPTQTVHVGPAAARADEVLVQEARVPAKTLRRRREKFLCSACGGYDIFSETDGTTVRVRCQQCKKEFPDLLQLVPVVEVGPLELFFGQGREAWIKGGALVGLWAVVYLVMRALA